MDELSKFIGTKNEKQVRSKLQKLIKNKNYFN